MNRELEKLRRQIKELEILNSDLKDEYTEYEYNYKEHKDVWYHNVRVLALTIYRFTYRAEKEEKGQ